MLFTVVCACACSYLQEQWHSVSVPSLGDWLCTASGSTLGRTTSCNVLNTILNYDLPNSDLQIFGLHQPDIKCKCSNPRLLPSPQGFPVLYSRRSRRSQQQQQQLNHIDTRHSNHDANPAQKARCHMLVHLCLYLHGIAVMEPAFVRSSTHNSRSDTILLYCFQVLLLYHKNRESSLLWQT